ncbi:hypothetical protein [Thermococcus henrietii]|uniref:hypothetical protein n=1 Tax=Thermococcus henrietii TaxID=2016361 RepID=UPI001314350F|nr:hypothetical protein [Thermococcus henrietii]
MGYSQIAVSVAFFVLIANLAAALLGTFFPDLAMPGGQIDVEQMTAQAEQLQPTAGDQSDFITALTMIKTFIGNLVKGNYDVWVAMGLDYPPGAAFTFARALQAITYLSYILLLGYIIGGRGL